MAVRVRFELTEPVKVQRFSRPPHSTTLPPHRTPASAAKIPQTKLHPIYQTRNLPPPPPLCHNQKINTPDPGLRSVVERFIAAAAQPALLDPGEQPLPLTSQNWSVSDWNGRLILQAWDSHRNLVRKIISLKEQRRDRISLITERFPRTPGEMQIADLAAATGPELRRKSTRIAFRDRFRLILAREFPDWRTQDLSTDPNLEQSLSPAFTRACLRRSCGPSSTAIAVLAAPPDAQDPSAILPFGLIWLDYLRRREPTLTIYQLLLYVPLHQEASAAARAAVLDPSRVACHLYVYDDRDCVGEIDLADAGNIKSTLPACHRPIAPNLEKPSSFDLPPYVDRIEQSDGTTSLRIRGLEFGRASGHQLFCGIGRKRPCSEATLAAMANEIARLRHPDAEDRQHPLYSQYHEGWLESQVLDNPQIIDASLNRTPIYGQVPVFTGPDRAIVDLLGIDDTGRLAVIEIKVAADLQLPFQALDYWLRVRKHLAAGDFERFGYFPDMTIRRDPPRILLVAPALEFHSTTEMTIEALIPHLDITRIGVAANWREELRVMFRLRGAERP